MDIVTYVISGGNHPPDYVEVDLDDGGVSHEIAMDLLSERFANWGKATIRCSEMEYPNAR